MVIHCQITSLQQCLPLISIKVTLKGWTCPKRESNCYLSAFPILFKCIQTLRNINLPNKTIPFQQSIQTYPGGIHFMSISCFSSVFGQNFFSPRHLCTSWIMWPLVNQWLFCRLPRAEIKLSKASLNFGYGWIKIRNIYLKIVGGVGK